MSFKRLTGREMQMWDSEIYGRISEIEESRTNADLAMVKAATSARADEVSDLARCRAAVEPRLFVLGSGSIRLPAHAALHRDQLQRLSRQSQAYRRALLTD